MSVITLLKRGRTGDRSIHGLDLISGLVLSLSVAGLIALLLILFSGRTEAQFVLHGKTDVASFTPTATEENPVVMRLPHASYIIANEETDFNPTERALEGVSSIVMSSEAFVDMQSRKHGELLITISKENDQTPDTIDIYDVNGLAHRDSTRTTIIVSCPPADCQSLDPIRIFIETKELAIGDTIRKWQRPPDSGGIEEYSQPILRSGKIQAFSQASIYGGRFQIDSLDLDTGDVALIRGLSKINVFFDFQETKSGRLTAQIYYIGKSIKLYRANGETQFSVDRYATLTKQPFLQLFWVAFVSVIIVLSFVITVAEVLSTYKRQVPPIKLNEPSDRPPVDPPHTQPDNPTTETIKEKGAQDEN